MAVGYNPKIVTDGLVLALDAGNTKSYVGSGTTWSDLIGNGNNGTLFGTPSFTAFPGYFDITSDSTYVRLSSYDHRTNDFTYSMWVKFDAFDSLDTLFENGSWTDSLLFRVESRTSINVYIEGALGGTFTWNPRAGIWYNVVYTRSGSTNTLYVNGTQSGSTFTNQTDINIANAYTFLMRSQYTTNQFTNGQMSQYAMYSKALTASEVQQNYNALAPRFSLPPIVIVTDGLVLNLDAGDSASYPGSGTTWTDLSGNGNNGTLTNGPTYSSANFGSLVFDGVDDYVNAPLTKTATCTFSCWARTTTLAGNPMLFNAGPNAVGPDLFFLLGNIYWNTWDGAGNPFATTPTSATNGNYHYYVVVNDASSNTKLYYDGNLLGTAAYRTAAANTNLTIGGNTDTYMWNGNISNFSAYNRALTASEVQQNYYALFGRYGN